VKSYLTVKFIKCFKALPERIRKLARKNYKIWKINHLHPSLNFREIKVGTAIYSIRVGIGWRALGILENDNIIWFWIGSHEEYNKLIDKLIH